MTNVKLKIYEMILVARRHHNYKLLTNIFIEDDRQKVIENADLISGTAIFTDGLGFEHKIGAVAVLMKNSFMSRTIKYHLGEEEIHTVYKAEALAVVLGIHALHNTNKLYHYITIGLDNQVVLMAL